MTKSSLPHIALAEDDRVGLVAAGNEERLQTVKLEVRELGGPPGVLLGRLLRLRGHFLEEIVGGADLLSETPAKDPQELDGSGSTIAKGILQRLPIDSEKADVGLRLR